MASSTRFPDGAATLAAVRVMSPRARRRRSAFSARRATSRRRRPSLRARRAVTPKLIQFCSRSTNFCSRRSSSASAAVIFSAQASNLAKPSSIRRTRRPSSQNEVLVTRSRNARSWLTISMAARLRVRRASIASMATMSRWLVGSSSRRTSGASAKARARAARRVSPPERPTVERAGSISNAINDASASCGAAPPATAKSSRVAPVIAGSWLTSTTFRPGLRNRSPESTAVRPPRMRSRVDLPAPLRPTRQARARVSSARSTPSNSQRGPSARRTSRRASRGGATVSEIQDHVGAATIGVRRRGPAIRRVDGGFWR